MRRSLSVFVVLLLASGTALGIVDLSFRPVSGTTVDAAPGDLVAVQSFKLNDTDGTVNTVATTTANNDSTHHDGLVRVELRGSGGAVLGTNASSFYLKKDRTVSCQVTFVDGIPFDDVRVTVVAVNTSVTIGKHEADCRGKGKGKGKDKGKGKGR